MKAIQLTDPDNPRSLELVDVADPTPGDGEVLVKVAAAGVNRGDLMQAKGMYPPPKGESDIIGLECAGVRTDTGEEVGCLLAGGGYAEYVAVPEGQLTPIPKCFDLVDTAGVVEVAATVWSNLGMIADVSRGDRVLIHGGAGGIGSFAIQLCKALGCEVAVTAGSAEKLEYCRDLGADITINYNEQDFSEELKGSCDAILDIMGGSYLEPNVASLAVDGRLVVIALQGGARLPVRDFQGIYSVSSPLADRACFRTDPATTEGAEVYGKPTPLISPRCGTQSIGDRGKTSAPRSRRRGRRSSG